MPYATHDKVNGGYGLFRTEDATKKDEHGDWALGDAIVFLSADEWQALDGPAMAPGEGPVEMRLVRTPVGDVCLNCARCRPCCTILEGNPPIAKSEQDSGCEFFDLARP